MVTRPALTVPACSLHDCVPGSLPGQAPPRGPPCLGLLLREATSRCFHGSLLPLCRTRKKPRARRENPRSRRAGMRLDTRSPPRSGWDPGPGGAAVGISGTLTLLRSGPRVRAASRGPLRSGGRVPLGRPSPSGTSAVSCFRIVCPSRTDTAAPRALQARPEQSGIL